MFMMLAHCIDCSHENVADCIKRHGQGARVYDVIGRKCVHLPLPGGVRYVPEHYYVLVDVFTGEMLEVDHHSILVRCPVTTRLETLCSRYKDFVEKNGSQEQSPSAEELLGCVEETRMMYPWARERKIIRGENGDYQIVGST